MIPTTVSSRQFVSSKSYDNKVSRAIQQFALHVRDVTLKFRLLLFNKRFVVLVFMKLLHVLTFTILFSGMKDRNIASK